LFAPAFRGRKLHAVCNITLNPKSNLGFVFTGQKVAKSVTQDKALQPANNEELSNEILAKFITLKENIGGIFNEQAKGS